MLKDKRDGCVMKAAVKPLCGIREIQFYERLRRKNEVDSHTAMLRELVPDYQGTVKCMFRGKLIDFIKLADITHGMSEPCIIDIKIGKRTWDPFASIDKQKAEEQKYKACKHTLGFCIPGFQVYDIKSGRIKRYGKEYGKKLTAENVEDGMSMATLVSELILHILFLSLCRNSIKDLFECRGWLMSIADNEISNHTVDDTIVGPLTNIVKTVFQLIAARIRCTHSEESIIV